MSDFYYSTDSDKHLENIGEKQEAQWDEQYDMELWEDLIESWDNYNQDNYDDFSLASLDYC